ncbi:hypothetical protein EBI00_02415 [Marinomonas hwangdonensis]|uniref:Uncharacterized protein n=1 Tax=Marinomonas hwangdonensis TaxID=1053647 RepID=A0A3M8QDA0_9GAMM|nr:hypothetical protein [Marinomonas hwangdonensis]RNF52974.1 hypothetical protein EBI00_02415 [Marinomonas hwangdonensis]
MKHLLIQTEKHIRTLCGVLIWGAVSYLLQDLGARLLGELSYLQLFWLITGITAVLVRSFFSLHSYKTELKTLKSKNAELLSDLHLLNPNYIQDKEFSDAFDEAVSKP